MASNNSLIFKYSNLLVSLRRELCNCGYYSGYRWVVKPSCWNRVDGKNGKGLLKKIFEIENTLEKIKENSLH